MEVKINKFNEVINYAMKNVTGNNVVKRFSCNALSFATTGDEKNFFKDAMYPKTVLAYQALFEPTTDERKEFGYYGYCGWFGGTGATDSDRWNKANSERLLFLELFAYICLDEKLYKEF